MSKTGLRFNAVGQGEHVTQEERVLYQLFSFSVLYALISLFYTLDPNASSAEGSLSAIGMPPQRRHLCLSYWLYDGGAVVF